MEVLEYLDDAAVARVDHFADRSQALAESVDIGHGIGAAALLGCLGVETIDIVAPVRAAERDELQFRLAHRRADDRRCHLAESLLQARQRRGAAFLHPTLRAKSLGDELLILKLNCDALRHQSGEILTDHSQSTGMKSSGLFHHKLDKFEELHGLEDL